MGIKALQEATNNMKLTVLDSSIFIKINFFLAGNNFESEGVLYFEDLVSKQKTLTHLFIGTVIL